MPAFNNLQLTTERLHLRPLRMSDAPALFGIFSDARIMTYWSTPPWTTMETATNLVERDLKALPAGEYLSFGIVRSADQQLLGTCSLFRFVEQCRRAEIGYGLAYDAWGNGYMHEALTALVNYGFDALNLNRIEADIDPRNTASARSLERLGFQREGFLRERWFVDGVVSDSALYGLLLSDWSVRK